MDPPCKLLDLSGPGLREDGFGQGETAAEQGRNLLKRSGRLYHGPVSAGQEKKNLVETDTFVLDELGRVGAQEDLLAESALHPGENLG